jgi:TorA maturation chaperone TorD
MGPVAATVTAGDSPRLAEARSVGYHILGRLIDEGVTSETLELAALSPRLAPLVAEESLESLAADHCHVFDLTAPPFEGLLADPEARVGHRAAMRLRQTLAAVDVTLGAEIEPEHLGAQLAVMSELSNRERSADPETRRRARRASALMLDRHLLHWLLPYEAAVARCERPYPSALLAEIVDLALHHRAELAEAVPAALPLAQPSCAAPDLDDPDTDLRAITSYLIRPAASGLVLTRSDITRLGRAVRVPRGFGDRYLLLFNLVRNAAGLDTLAQVIDGLDDLAASQAAYLEERIAPLGQRCDHLVAPWRRRIATTRSLLRTIRSQASSPSSESNP